VNGEDFLDDSEALEAADHGDLLRQVASAAAQVRRAQLLTAETDTARLRTDERPRAIVVAGVGGSGIVGDALAALCGPGCPIPVVTVRAPRLPGWVGATDLVVAVSRTGRTDVTLNVAAEAARRGCRLLCVAAARSPLADLAAQYGAPVVSLPPGDFPGTAWWGLLIPVLLVTRAFGLVAVPDDAVEAAAARLEDVSHRCRPVSESFVNPGKQLALDLEEDLPVVWGTTPLSGVAAHRMATRLTEDAGRPALWGELPGAAHEQGAALSGGGSLRLVVLKDQPGEPAEAGDAPVSELRAEEGHPLARLAELVALGDYTAAYLGLAARSTAR
jgi:glucose/mannose-6-phosphate isomerase